MRPNAHTRRDQALYHVLQHRACFPAAPQADKRYQLADWRLRPLSPDMLHYARCDTHYLLHVADRLRQQLAELPEDKVRTVHRLPPWAHTRARCVWYRTNGGNVQLRQPTTVDCLHR